MKIYFFSFLLFTPNLIVSHSFPKKQPPTINVALFNKTTRAKIQLTKFDNETEYIHPFDVTEVHLDNKRLYYVSAWDKVACLDEDFVYLRDIDFPNYKQALSIVNIDNSLLLMTDFADEVFIDTDQLISTFNLDLKLINTFNMSGATLTHLFYDDLNEMIYVTDFSFNQIYIFNKNLTQLLDKIRIVQPWYAMTMNGQIFVSSINRITILDAKTKAIVRVLDGLCENSGDVILKFSVDVNENIVYPCLYWSDLVKNI